MLHSGSSGVAFQNKSPDGAHGQALQTESMDLFLIHSHRYPLCQTLQEHTDTCGLLFTYVEIQTQCVMSKDKTQSEFLNSFIPYNNFQLGNFI